MCQFANIMPREEAQSTEAIAHSELTIYKSYVFLSKRKGVKNAVAFLHIFRRSAALFRNFVAEKKTPSLRAGCKVHMGENYVFFRSTSVYQK